MVLEAKTDAPELALDSSSQAGFCKWFQSLPQVRGIELSSSSSSSSTSAES
jgi:hypothetical protein